MTCRRRDESSSLLLQVNEPFYDSPQLFPTSQSSFKELIWASPYYFSSLLFIFLYTSVNWILGKAYFLSYIKLKTYL